MTTAAPPPAGLSASVTPSPKPGRVRTVRIVLVVLAAVIVLGYMAALSLAAGRINALLVTVSSEDLPGGMRSLTIDAGDAGIRVQVDPQTNAPHVELRTVDSSSAQRRMQITSDGDSTRIVVPPDSGSFMDWGRSGDLTVTLPTALARALSVTTQQDDGALTVDADLDQLTAYTADGDIALNAGARRVDITTTDGDVVAQKPIPVADSFIARTLDGDVRVEFKASAPRTIEAGSRDGDIAIALPGPGPYLVDASATSAEIQVPETNDATKAAATVTVRTVDGNVVVDTSGDAR
jgi:hypothetical protein